MSAYFTHKEYMEMFEAMMDKFEKNMSKQDLRFSQRHRLRWWAARAFRFWIKQNAPEKVEFT